MIRPLIDRFLMTLVFLILRAFFRSVEVTGRDRIPDKRPMLVVANHFNGLVDAVLLAHVLGRVPRFLAKSTLWKVRLARPLYRLAGMVPVHRAEDRGSEDRLENLAAFESAHRLLAKRGVVAIFPEGVTHDVPALARIRTGAARIALSARRAGVEGLVIVPVGLAFDNKLALRSRALARVGEPIDLDPELDAYVRGDETDADNPDAVRRLTTELEGRLRAVSPDYRDAREAAVLSRAAEITRRTGLSRQAAQVPLAEQEPLAQKLAYAPEVARNELTGALARYQLDLDLVGLRDHQVVPGYSPRQLLAEFLVTALVVGLLAPLWLVGLVVNAVPYYLVKEAGRATVKPVMKGTSRALCALVVFPLTWAAVILVIGAEGYVGTAAVVVYLPIAGLVGVWVVERIVRAFRAYRGWQALRDRRALLGEILADRRRLVAAAEEAALRVPEGAERAPAAR